MARAIRLEPIAIEGDEPTGHLPLGGEVVILAIRHAWRVLTRLPCDLAHTIAIEFDGTPGQFPGRPLIVSGQGLPPGKLGDAETIGAGLTWARSRRCPTA